MYLPGMAFLPDACGRNMIHLREFTKQTICMEESSSYCRIMAVRFHLALVYAINLDKSVSFTMVYTEWYQTV
jgi:hypothetical protein